MNQQTCNRDRLDAFLKNDLNQREEQMLTSHLDECSDCREELESRAAEQSVWREASSLLRGSITLSTAAIGESRSGTVHSPQIALVLQQLAPTDDPESMGRIGGYEVTGVVGAGGMGVVLKAHDRSLDRIVAIKVMSPHLSSSGSARKRFAREAKAAAAVLHPNVIAIHSVASEDANPYLVMPFVRGASLQKRIDSQGPLPLKDTLRIGAQIAAGLAAAHEQGLVHRDIKPANILLEEGVERVTITDFGLARAVDDASMTCSGVIAGTPQYMSPEQARGEPIDARSDLFSLGGVLYAMCTGRSPFRAETTYGVLHRIANDKPTPVCEINTDVPVWLGHVIERLMAKRPEDRFESAAQVAELLEGCLAHVQQPAAMPLPEAVTALAPIKTRRPPIGKLIVAAAFVLAFIIAGVFVVLELNKGTLTIQSDVDDIRVRITRGEDVVNELKVTKSGQSVRIAAGQYQVEIIGDTDGLTVENGKVTLRRADAEVVKIIRNTHDDNQPTYTDPHAALQAYRSNSSDSLSETIDQFNLKRTKDPLNDQPPLTKDELIACASWNVERNHELTEPVKAALRKIAKQHPWPEGWWIDGSYLDLPPYATPVRAYRISLVHSTTGEVFTVRQRFIEPPSTYVKPVLNMSTDGTQLWAAIKRFNARYNQANGYKQPPLTENEVVAAIVHHQTKRDEADVSDALFEKFQQIARQRYLPEETSLEVIPTFGVEGGSTYTIWSVRIKMFLDEAGKEGWTHAFKIREQFVSVKYRDAGEIHWGQPKENGLQAGVRLSPPLLSYELGQKIDVEVFYRNILTTPISATVPNFCGNEAAMRDANGNMMEILDLQEDIVGGARSETIGNEPISSHGRSLAFAPSSLAKDTREEYGIKTGASTLAFVEPGNSYRLQFTVSNLADSAAEPLKTGEVEIAVEKVRKSAVGVADATPERMNTRQTENQLNTSSKSSPELPPVKIVVHDEESKPLEGVKVSLRQLAKDQGGQVLEINETSNANGLAVNRNLPYGHYELTATTADGWYLTGLRSRLNVEFEKGVDATLVAPTPGKISKVVISSGITSSPDNISGLRFGGLTDDRWTEHAPEPEGSDSFKEKEFSSFPTITNGIEYVGADIRLEIWRSISQPAPSMQQMNTRWYWSRPPNSKVSTRYLIANGQARSFNQFDEEGYTARDGSLTLPPVEGSEFFKPPGLNYHVRAELLKLRETTQLPLELDIPAGDVRVKIGSFFGKPSAAVMAALKWQPREQQPELWLQAYLAPDSAWVERLINIDWINSPFRSGGSVGFTALWRDQTLQPGERLEIPLGMTHPPENVQRQTKNTSIVGHWKVAKLAHLPANELEGATVVIDKGTIKMQVPSQKGPHPHWRYTTGADGEIDLNEFDDAKGDTTSYAKFLLEGKTLYLAVNAKKGDYPRPESARGEPQDGVLYIVLELDELASSTRTVSATDRGDEKLDGKPEVPEQPQLGKTLQQLQGKWRLSRQIAEDGDESGMPSQSVWEFKGDRVIVRDSGPGGAMLIEVDDSQSPVHVKMTIEIDEESGLGLLSLEGDKVILCLGKRQKTPDPHSRPEKLQWVAGVFYMELIRMKPGETVVPSKPSVVLPMARSSVVLPMNESAISPLPVAPYERHALSIDHGNARSVVEAYVASALAGDFAKAASLAKNSPADPKRIRELPEFLNVQRLKIETVYINDPAKPTQALATSVEVKLDEEHKNPDGRRDGVMVFTLEFTDEKWFVIDIDFETESGAEKELNKFLKANPNSIGIPPQS